MQPATAGPCRSSPATYGSADAACQSCRWRRTLASSLPGVCVEAVGSPCGPPALTRPDVSVAPPPRDPRQLGTTVAAETSRGRLPAGRASPGGQGRPVQAGGCGRPTRPRAAIRSSELSDRRAAAVVDALRSSPVAPLGVDLARARLDNCDELPGRSVPLVSRRSAAPLRCRASPGCRGIPGGSPPQVSGPAPPTAPAA